MKYSACIEMLFAEADFYARPKAAAEAGMDAIEFWSWADKDLNALAEASAAAGLPISCCCVDTADAARRKAWSRWGALDRRNHSVLEENVVETIETLAPMGVNVFILTVGQTLPTPRWIQHASIVDGLKRVAPVLEKANATLVLEPLNPLVDHRGYYLDTSYEAFDILRQIDSPAVKLLFDVYHQQVTEGNLIDNIRNNAGLIGHFHTADVPGRNQPGTGEICFSRVFKAIEDTGYAAYVGLEFTPKGASTRESLADVIALRAAIGNRQLVTEN